MGNKTSRSSNKASKFNQAVEELPCILCGKLTIEEDAVCSNCKRPDKRSKLEIQLEEVTRERDAYKELLLTIIKSVARKSQLTPVRTMIEHVLREEEEK